MKVTQNKRSKNVKFGILIASLVQLGMCGMNVQYFGIVTVILLCYLGFVFIKKRKNVVDWLKLEHLMIVVILVEILFGCSVFYLFNNVI